MEPARLRRACPFRPADWPQPPRHPGQTCPRQRHGRDAGVRTGGDIRLRQETRAPPNPSTDAAPPGASGTGDHHRGCEHGRPDFDTRPTGGEPAGIARCPCPPPPAHCCAVLPDRVGRTVRPHASKTLRKSAWRRNKDSSRFANILCVFRLFFPAALTAFPHAPGGQVGERIDSAEGLPQRHAGAKNFAVAMAGVAAVWLASCCTAQRSGTLNFSSAPNDGA